MTDEFDQYKVNKFKEIDEFEQYKIKQPSKEEFDFGLALENLGTGALGKLKDLVSPNTYINIYKTIKAIGPYERTPEGYFKKSEFPAELGKSIINDFVGKYGSWEKVKKTFQDTPIEPVLDASMVLTGGGISLAKVPGVAGKIGEVAKVAGMATDPFNVAMTPLKLLKLASANKINQISQRLYDSGVKISSKLDLDEIHRTAQRGLDLKILSKEKGRGVTGYFRGLDELKKDMDQIGIKIDKAIDKGTKSGEYLDTWKIADSIDDLKTQFGSRLFHDPELVKIVDDLKISLIELHGDKIPISTAQDLKRSTQRFLRGSYDRLSALKIEAEKIATAEIRKELEVLHPELAKLNPTQQENIWLKEAITSAIKSQEKAPMVPGISFFNALKNRTLDSPLLKERIGIILDRIRKLRTFSPETTLGREAIYQTANPMEEAMKFLGQRNIQLKQ